MYVCKYCGKEFESKQKLGGHINWCKDNPNKKGKSNFNTKKIKDGIRKIDVLRSDLFCQYCGKQYKNINSLKQHEIRCGENPNKIIFKSNFIAYNNDIHDGIKTHWCKGKTKENCESIKKRTETLSERYANGTIKKVGKYIENSVKGCYKYGYYNGIRCDSSWELAFVVYCVENNIPIERNYTKFLYNDGKKDRYFIPDFLVKKNELFEIKGKQDAMWEVKFKTFPNVKFIFKQDIQPYLEYCIKKYGKNFTEILYEKK